MLFGCAAGDSYEVGGADQYRCLLRPVVVNSIDHYCSAHGAVVVRPPTSSATECLPRRRDTAPCGEGASSPRWRQDRSTYYTSLYIIWYARERRQAGRRRMGKKGIEYLTSLKKQPKHRAMLQMIPGIIIDCIRVLFIAIVRGTFAVHFFFFFGEIMTYAMALVREDRGSCLRP